MTGVQTCALPIYPYVIFYLDDEDIRFQKGFETPVPDGAEIVVVPAIAGG